MATQPGGDGVDERVLGPSLIRCRQWLHPRQEARLRRRTSTGSGVSTYAGCPERYDGPHATAGLSTASSNRSLSRWQWQWQQQQQEQRGSRTASYSSGSLDSHSIARAVAQTASASTVFSAAVAGMVESNTTIDPPAVGAEELDDEYEVVHHHHHHSARLSASTAEVNGVAPGPAEAPGPAMPSAAAIAQIFLVGQPPAGRRGRSSRLRAYARRASQWLLGPLAEEEPRLVASTAASVAKAEAALGRAVRVLEKTRDSQSSAFRARADRVHVAQARVLGHVHRLFVRLVAQAEHGSRHYRFYLPEEDQAELDRGFSESVLFAAQALARGFQIRGTEPRTLALRDPAALLCAAWAAVRHVIAAKSPDQADSLRRVLADFDDAWVRFERDLCFAYFGLAAATEEEEAVPGAIDDEFALLVVLLSETLQRCVSLRLVSQDCVESMDPQVMLALPRLAILHAIHNAHPADSLCFVQSAHAPVFWWFRDYAPQCARIAQALAHMPPPLYAVLMRMLVAEEADVVLADAMRAQHPPPPPPSPTATTATVPRRMTMDDLESIIDSPRPESEPLFLMSIIDSPRPESPLSDTLYSTPRCCPHSLLLPTAKDPDLPSMTTVLKQTYVDLCTVADSLHSGPFARPFRVALELVFRMNLDTNNDDDA
ncbi:hypothetical protein IWW38_001944 [Coemansia aciculifera]|uniref:Uncharacterized protein n=1 Tax=Coemansia aciculifera TaxID=417176 RepID=A0ACC1M5B5_9FUNG|nr:hypothetical protein IWW38_001944 [Coemansia aciculifera]